MTTADLYARKSTKDEGQSAERQEGDWRTDCAREGITPGRVFVDPDLSASRWATKDRPDYAELLTHIRSGACSMLALWEASRGSRELGEWVAFLELCRARGVLIRIFGGGGHTYDVRKRRDWRALASDGLDAADESWRMSERVGDGKRDAAVKGRSPGPLPYGYEVVEYDRRRRPVRVGIVAEEAAVVRRCARDALDGKPLNTIARKLNAERVPTASGVGRWQGARIHGMLRSPAYAGHRVHNGEIVKRDAWPAILDQATHDDLVALLTTPGRRNHANGTLTYQGSGAYRCGLCGAALRVSAAWGNRRTRYVCPACWRVGASVSDVDGLIDGLVVERLRQPDAAEVFTPARDDAALTLAKNERADLRNRLDAYQTRAARGQITDGEYAVISGRMRPLIEAADLKVRELSRPAVLRDVDPEQLAADWPDTPIGIRREVILALADVVLSPAAGKGVRFTPGRLGGSRWVGSAETWGEIWQRGLL